MAGKKKSKQKNGPTVPLPIFGPSYSMANNSSAASTTTTTIIKKPLITTTTSGDTIINMTNIDTDSDKDKDKNSNKKNFNPSISYFDSISKIDKRISEGDTDASALDFEELSAIINGQSTDVNGVFRNNRDKNLDSKNMKTNGESAGLCASESTPEPKKKSNLSQEKNKSQHERHEYKDKDSVESDDGILYNNNEDELFPKIVKVCSMVANATNQASAHISKNNKSKSSSNTSYEEDSSSKSSRKSQNSLLGDGPQYGGGYAKENGNTGSGYNMMIGGFEDDDDEVDDTIIQDYPDESQFYNLENAGHFLTGSGGLETLTAQSLANSYDSDIPKLATCTTMWDGIINICEISTCSKSANKKCGLCKSAYYCSEDHQRLDWRKHRNECIAYKVECIGHKDGPIFAMVATRDIQEGELIFNEKPVLVLPLAQPTDNFTHVMDLECVRSVGTGVSALGCCKAVRPSCFGCLKPIDTTKGKEFLCSKCGLLLCSAKCEYSMDHINHECQAISNAGPWYPNDLPNNICLHCLYMDIEILRAIRMAYYGNANEEWEAFLGLKHNVRVKAYRSTDQFYNFTKQARNLVPYSAKVSGYNFDLIADIHSIITALAYRPSLDTAFKMLFENQSLFVHNCIPNTFHFVENLRSGSQHQMKLMTKSAIPIVRGEIISIDFVPSPYLPYKTRKKCLKNLSIDCECNRCHRPSEQGDHSGDIKCPNCREGFVRAEAAEIWEESVWSCHICQEELPFCNISKIEDEAQSALARIPKSREGLRSLLDFVEKQQGVLHPHHSIIISAWCFIESIIRERVEFEREPSYLKKYSDTALHDFKLLARYCEVVGPHLDLVRQGLWVDKGILLFHKFYSNYVLASAEFQAKSLIRKEYISRVLKAMKCLQEGLKHLITFYEGGNGSCGTAPKYVISLTQEGTYAMSSLKEFITHMMMKDAAESNSNQFRGAATPTTPTSTNL